MTLSMKRSPPTTYSSGGAADAPWSRALRTVPDWLVQLRGWGSRLAGRSDDLLGAPEEPGEGRAPRLRKKRPYFYFVILPVLVTAAYLFLIAANQYESETHFFVASAQQSPTQNQPNQGVSSTFLQEMMGGAGTSMAEVATLATVDFMGSHDAVTALQDSKVPLTEIYHRAGLDLVSRMNRRPSVENLYNYLYWFPGMVESYIDFTHGLGVLKVYAFRPEDASAISEALLKRGDELVHEFDQRAYDEALRVARAELARTEQRVKDSEKKITEFRLREQAIDPNKSTQTVLDVISSLESNLAQARADLTAAKTYMRTDSAQYAQMANKVSALEAQIEAENVRLTGTDGSVAPTLMEWEQLSLDHQFATQDYNSALNNLEQARQVAEKQDMFLVRVVGPTHPEESEYPRRLVILLTLFIGLSVAYGIGWLIVAGIHEHTG